MKPRLGAACLITVLGARRESCRALVLALEAGLAAQGLAANVLPSHAPHSCETPSCASVIAALAEQQQALNLALGSSGSSTLLSEGGIALLAAEMGSSAPDELAAAAQAQLARSTLVLLCAASARDSAPTRALDARLRSQLLAARVSFSVLHGDADSAFAQAWQVLCMSVSDPLQAAQPSAASATHRPWLGNCDACSDSACEHRLFSDLLARRVEA